MNIVISIIDFGAYSPARNACSPAPQIKSLQSLRSRGLEAFLRLKSPHDLVS